MWQRVRLIEALPHLVGRTLWVEMSRPTNGPSVTRNGGWLYGLRYNTNVAVDGKQAVVQKGHVELLGGEENFCEAVDMISLEEWEAQCN